MSTGSLYRKLQVTDPIKCSADPIKLFSDLITEQLYRTSVGNNKNGHWEIIGKEDEV